MLKCVIRLCGLGIFAALSACTTVDTRSVDKPQQDGYPQQPVSVNHIPDAVPREEIRTIAGNKTPYKVLGKTYHVMPKPDGYREAGMASWYGTKFHGRRTSNGELYDMYGMTAAHKTLPIPSYVRVTNTKNNRSVIVRVNDRGPFHGNRIIDLTYTAAKKLGFENIGTAPVTVEYIDPLVFNRTPQNQPTATQVATLKGSGNDNAAKETPAPTPVNSAGYKIPENTYLQVGAFSAITSAESLRDKLQSITNINVWVLASEASGRALHKVLIGPFRDNFQLMNVRQQIIDANFTEPHVVYR
ncbi:Endolytic peptidoglycan transglycosylase RlpA [Thalassocella blandensis]|nr:Endolytic peptidoglycan transglycosylase RlpA [Thalassocella blandensis]